jgi:hypothetical protein
MSEFDPGYELQALLVQALRQDEDLHNLLFPSDLPQTDDADTRIYEAEVDLPPTLRSTLPRVLVAVTIDTVNWEQEDHLGDLGPATVYIHHFTAHDDSVRLQKMEVVTTNALRALGGTGSTGSPSTRIMVGPLVKTGPQIKDRQPAFDDARRITDTYVTRLVGVLV